MAGRKTYVWDDVLGQLVDVTEFVQAARAQPRVHLITDAGYHDLRATDGTDISSYTKHKRYMKERGLTTADDFKQTWAKAAERRAAIAKGDYIADKARREAIEKALHTVYEGPVVERPKYETVEKDVPVIHSHLPAKETP